MVAANVHACPVILVNLLIVVLNVLSILIVPLIELVITADVLVLV
jgi:hypothetical protein